MSDDRISDARRREILARVKEAARLVRQALPVDNVTKNGYVTTLECQDLERSIIISPPSPWLANGTAGGCQ